MEFFFSCNAIRKSCLVDSFYNKPNDQNYLSWTLGWSLFKKIHRLQSMGLGYPNLSSNLLYAAGNTMMDRTPPQEYSFIKTLFSPNNCYDGYYTPQFLHQKTVNSSNKIKSKWSKSSIQHVQVSWWTSDNALGIKAILKKLNRGKKNSLGPVGYHRGALQKFLRY